jgi:prepilin-type N-terminal cleavage/methylation domain-containing protein
MKKAFTIAELMVAVALMAVVLTGTGYVFKVAIDSQRLANATTEIMRNLRGITDQIDSDFAGLQKDAPLAFWFQQDGGSDPNRFDEIMFFASGDFSCCQSPVYGTGGKTLLKGDAARIWYGQADSHDSMNTTNLTSISKPSLLLPKDRVLARNQHVLISPISPPSPDPYIDWPGTDFVNFNTIVNGINKRYENEVYEYDKFPLARWKLVRFDPDFKTTIVPYCLGDSGGFTATDSVRPNVDSSDPNTYQNLMCKGVASFAVQWGYWYDDGIAKKEWRWWPSADPDGDGLNTDSHFALRGNPFGVYFNVSGTDFVTTNGENWYAAPIVAAYYEPSATPAAYPQALKFTIKLCDSKGIIKKPMTFTHIVYLK